MTSDEENKEKRLKFPKAAPFILSNVFLERICSGGVLAILVLFFNQKLEFSADTSTALFHAIEFVLYFFTIVGAIIADSWLGLFKTISWMTSLSFFGAGLIAVVSVDALQLPIKIFSLVGLIAFVVASGGIRTNQYVFGGNQFKLPEQDNQLNAYFSLQYFVLRSGLLVGQLVIPILKNDVKCFGTDTCFPLAFGFPAVLMLISFLLLLSGRRFYVQVPPADNMFVKICGCIANAIKERFVKRKTNPKDHWLDYAEEKCGEKLVAETKVVLNVLTIFLTLPLFWAMYEQNGSRWVFQAIRMNGDLGFYTIKPEQMMMFTNGFAIAMLPVVDLIIYPILSKVGIKSKLQKVACGYVCCAISFVVAAIIELKIKDNYIHMLWLLPQYFIIATSEIFVWVPTVTFAYTQAPDTLKSVMTSFVYLMVAVGSLFVVFVSATNLVKSQMYEFLMYSGLMVLNLIWFAFMAKNYKFIDQNSSSK